MGLLELPGKLLGNKLEGKLSLKFVVAMMVLVLVRSDSGTREGDPVSR